MVYFLIFNIVFNINPWLQESNAASNYEVTYKETLDNNSPIPLDREAKLIYSAGESLYYSARAEKHGLKGKDWKGNNINAQSFSSSSSSKDYVEGGLLFRTYAVDPFGNCVYISYFNKIMKVRSMDELTIIYDEPTIPKMKWDVFKDSTLQVGKYNCIKARTNFRGREYDVWFTPEIPINIGPWKLNGLPGLILKAEDIDGKIKFDLIQIKTQVEKMDMSRDIKNWTGKKCNFEESKTIGLEWAIKNWIKSSNLSFRQGSVLILNINLNDYIERYSEEHNLILKKYRQYLTIK